MKDVHSTMEVVNVVTPQLANVDVTVSDIDMQGFEAAEIIFQMGTGGIVFDEANRIVTRLRHSDDGVTYTDVPGAHILGRGLSAGGGELPAGDLCGFVAEHATPKAYRFGYVGGKRYLEIVVDFAGTHGASTPIAATIIKMRPHNFPTPDQNV